MNDPYLTDWAREQHARDGGHRAALVQGLIDAAHYLAAHPEVPVPPDVAVHFCIPAADDKAGEDEAYRIARILGAKVTGDDSSETALDFGPAVSYRAVYITQGRAAAYRAHMASYHATREDAAELAGAAR
jgi:hypothetical protein